jgi:hypothetical protein
MAWPGTTFALDPSSCWAGSCFLGYPWIGCECCKGTVWVPFKMLRERIPMLSAMTLDQLGAKMRCDKCVEWPERYYPANQSDTPGFVRSFK